MKTKLSYKNSFRPKPWFLAIGGGTLLAFTSLNAQDKVVIEGGPKKVAISDEDGKPEGALSKAEVRRAAMDQKGDVKAKNGDIVTTTTTTTVVRDIDNDGRLERIKILRKELNVIDTEVGPLIRLNADVLFDFDKTAIKPGAADMLDNVAEFIRLSRDGKVEVVGYADAIGSKEYNSDLAWNRSLSVVNWLQKQEGFNRDRFRAVGRGEEGAVAPNTDPDGSDNPEGRAQNRRVEILIRNQAKAPLTTPALK